MIDLRNERFIFEYFPEADTIMEDKSILVYFKDINTQVYPPRNQ